MIASGAKSWVSEAVPERWAITKTMNLGSGAFIGLGAYTYFSGNSQLEQQKARIIASKSRFGMRSRRMGIASISLGLAAMGFWRLVGWMKRAKMSLPSPLTP
jgi:hypothetical protein